MSASKPIGYLPLTLSTGTVYIWGVAAAMGNGETGVATVCFCTILGGACDG